MTTPHQAATWERTATEGIIRVAQDTPYLNFTRHAAPTGLGPMGAGTEQGLLLQSALARTTAGVPLGLVGQIAWARDPDTRGKRAYRKPWPIEEKDRDRWLPIQQQMVEFPYEPLLLYDVFNNWSFFLDNRWTMFPVSSHTGRESSIDPENMGIIGSMGNE